jgi:hypothetical protein
MVLLFGIEEVLAFVRPLCNPEIVYFIIILNILIEMFLIFFLKTHYIPLVNIDIHLNPY